MGQYILGVDGGGTKTKCALYEIVTGRLELIDWGPTNHECLAGGYAGLHNELKKLFDHIFRKTGIGIDELAVSAFGMAGDDRPDQHKEISGIISSLGIKRFLLCNDAYLGIKAGSPSGCGICVINGTGCTIAGIDQNGRMLQIGGVGAISDDPGGGGVLGFKVINTVYRHLFRCGPYTSMAGYIFDMLGINSKYEYAETVARKLEDGTLIVSDLNRLLFRAANEGDQSALKILENAGFEMGCSVNGMLEELDFERCSTVPIIFAGSINVRGENPAMLNALKNEVLSKNRERNIVFKILQSPPVAGAVLWGMSELYGMQYEHAAVLNGFDIYC